MVEWHERRPGSPENAECPGADSVEDSERMITDELLQDMKARLKSAFGQRFQGVVLYGSEARGEATEDSDIDLLVLLEAPIALGQDLETIIHVLYPLQLEVIRPIHAVPVAPEEYEAGEFALCRFAKAEGILA